MRKIITISVAVAALFGLTGFVAQQTIGYDSATNSVCVYDRATPPQCVPIGTLNSITHVFDTLYRPTSPATTTRTVSSKLDDMVSPADCGAVADGVTDDAGAIETCAAKAAAQGKTLVLNGSYAVSTVVLHPTGANPLSVLSAGILKGIGPRSGYASVLDIGGTIAIKGNLKIGCQANVAYKAGAWLRGVSGAAAQYANIHGVGFDSCAVGWKIGDAAYPGAIVSENTIVGGWNYNTPTAIYATGWNTVVTFIGPNYNSTSNGWFSSTSATNLTIANSGSMSATIGTGLTIPVGSPIEFRASASGAGADHQLGTVTAYNATTGSVTFTATGGFGVGATHSAWRVTPQLAGIIAEGATVTVMGGEVGMPAELGRLVSLRPSPNGASAYWGHVYLQGVTTEVPGVYADTMNPAGYTIDGNIRGTLSMSGVSGYVSQDLGPYVVTTSDFRGIISAHGLGFVSPVARTSASIAAGGPGTKIDVSAGGFGANFTASYTGGDLLSPIANVAATNVDLLVGASASNWAGLSRAVNIWGAYGTAGMTVAVGSNPAMWLGSDGTSYSQVVGYGSYPLYLGAANTTTWKVTPAGTFGRTSPVTVSALPTCSSTYDGQWSAVSDATSSTYGATAAGGGSNHVPVYCNGTNWTVR